MIRLIKTVYYIIKDDFRNGGLEHFSGSFRVMYDDGRVSQRMYYHNAESYSLIFGGKIIFHYEKNKS